MTFQIKKGPTRRVIRATQAGELRHLGDLQQLIVTQDSTGAAVSTYVTWAAGVRFAIDDWKGIENFITDRVEASLTTRIRIRYREGVVENMRLAHTTNPGAAVPAIDYYQITGIIRDITLRKELQLICLRRGMSAN